MHTLLSTRGLKSILYFQFLSLLSFRLIVIVHEIAGHGLAEWLVGYKIQGYYISYFGGAFLVTQLQHDPLQKYLIVMAAGCFMQIVVGGFLVLRGWLQKRNPLLGFSLIVMGGWFILFAFIYLLLSIITSDGDGYALIRFLDYRIQKAVFITFCILLAESSFLMALLIKTYLNRLAAPIKKSDWILALFVVLVVSAIILDVLPLLERTFIRPVPSDSEIVDFLQSIKVGILGCKISFNPLEFCPLLLILTSSAVGLFYPRQTRNIEGQLPTIIPSWRSIIKIGLAYAVVLLGIYALRLSPLCL